MNKFYLVIFLIILITVGVIALWNLIISTEEKKTENRMDEVASNKNPNCTICNYCKLYADSEHGYCFYAGECTTYRDKCRYFIEKKEKDNE